MIQHLTTAAVSAAISAALAGWLGWHERGLRCTLADQQRTEAAAEVARHNHRTAQSAAVTYEHTKERERVVYKTITETVDRIVDRPIYRSACFDADGLRALNAAINGRAADTPSPGRTVP